MLRELRRVLPQLDYTYLGDNGRAPYGGRDLETVLDFSEQCVELLFAEGCRVVVVACHTVSSVALRHLQHRYGSAERRVLGVTIPAAENAVAVTRGHIGFIGTARTVASGTFTTEVRKLSPSVRVTEIAAPLLAPIVEENWERTEIARLAVERYVAQFGDIDTLVLGCTHFPLLREVFLRCVPGTSPCSTRRRSWPGVSPNGSHATRNFEARDRAGSRVLSSGDTTRFAKNASRYLGAEPPRSTTSLKKTAGSPSRQTAAIPSGSSCADERSSRRWAVLDRVILSAAKDPANYTERCLRGSSLRSE